MEILSEYANFLRMRGRFKDIEFEESDGDSILVAHPLYDDQRVEARFDHRSQMVQIGIAGIEPAYLIRETSNFFKMYGLEVREEALYIRVFDDVEVSIRGSGNQFKDLREELKRLLRTQTDAIMGETTVIVFDKEVGKPSPVPAKVPEEIPVELKEPIKVPTTSKVEGVPATGEEVFPVFSDDFRDGIFKDERLFEEYALGGTEFTDSVTLSLVDEEKRILRVLLDRPRARSKIQDLGRTTGFEDKTLRISLNALLKKGVIGYRNGWFSLQVDGAVLIPLLRSKTEMAGVSKAAAREKTTTTESEIAEPEIKILKAIITGLKQA